MQENWVPVDSNVLNLDNSVRYKKSDGGKTDNRERWLKKKPKEWSETESAS